MKLLQPSLLVLAIAGIIAPAAVAGQPSGEMGWGQKARPDPIVTPTIQAIVNGMNLLAPDAVSADAIAGGAESLATSSTEATSYSALSGAEEVVMLAFTVPAEPPSPPAIIAQASVQGATPTQDVKTVTFCRDTESLSPDTAFNDFSPISTEFLQQIGAKHGFTIDELKSYRVTLVTPTQHGQVRLTDEPSHAWSYLPTKGYTGADRAIYLVQNLGKQYKVVVNFWVVEIIDENRTVQECESIKFETPNGSSTTVSGLTAISLSDFEAWQREAQLSSLINTVSDTTISFADLLGAAVGQTTGSTITLDTNAAGYNWFIDTTPADNSEFLPTSNPNEWVAKEGSAAFGKMDMLSVLLHEYGHALGIEHSADSHDYMATTLTAGVRRMPSADELALMQQLVGQVKAGLAESTLSPTLPLQGGGGFPTLPLGANFIGFLGLLRSSRYGGVSIAPAASTLVTKYAVAANATLTNGSLNAADGWSTQGGVDIGPSTSSGTSTGSVRTDGGATLYEVSGSQTRLSQVFMVNERDRFLSFTLSGTALDNLTGAPDDAFEVALLDANTGVSLLGGTGLTRSDAFLNLQADGTQNAANCVTCINNADGSRTYRVDLAGIAAGTAVNLSFDLIGFGLNGSHVTVRWRSTRSPRWTTQPS